MYHLLRPRVNAGRVPLEKLVFRQDVVEMGSRLRDTNHRAGQNRAADVKATPPARINAPTIRLRTPRNRKGRSGSPAQRAPARFHCKPACLGAEAKPNS